MRVEFVNLSRQYERLREEILACMDRVGRGGHYVLGPEVEEFEKAFADYCGTRHAVGVASGSDALLLSLLALGIGEEDEVIIPPNSFVATAWTVARTGAKIVFADVDERMNLDPRRVEEAITEKTRAVMPVHFSGRVANMEVLEGLAEAHGLHLVEDAAQAVGALRHGKKAGSFGVCAGFSLHPLKNLHVYGDAGVITTSSTDLRDHLVTYRNHGLKNRDVCEFWGINSRIDSLQAGIALIKLKYMEEWTERFREIAHRYRTALGAVVGVPGEEEDEAPVYHRFMITHTERDELQRFLAEQGVATKVNYPIPLHLQPAASDLGHTPGDFPVTERLADTILSLPLYPELLDDEVDYVIEQVLAYFK